MKNLKFLLWCFTGIFSAIYLLYVTYIYVNQEEMVFRRHALEDDYVFGFQDNFKEIRVKSLDGKLQHGLLFPVPHPKGIIFYLHGNAGAIDSWGAIATIYTKMGYDFFIIDYRGFGKSQGIIENEAQVMQDVTLVFDAVTKKYSKKIIIGYSIGTGIAASLASIRKNNMLVLKAPYNNFLEYSDSRAPYFPDFLKKFSFETNYYLPKINSPIYIFHGDKDLLIPIENSFRLQKLLKPSDSLFVLENQDHLGINANLAYQKNLGILLQ